MTAGLTYRTATVDDLAFMVELIVDDAKSPTNDRRDEPHHAGYLAGLAAIDADPNQMLIIAEEAGVAVGTFQLTYIPGIARLGGWRGLIESVHVAPEHRSRGIGGAMIRWAIERCRERGCVMVQLTSHKARLDAHRFYQRLGFTQSHEGFKLQL